MKAMLFSDLITSRNASLQLLGISAFVGAFIAIATGQLVTAVGCVAAMVPFMYLFSISAYDEQNGWERFRLTLPLTRRQIAYGRYISMACVMVVSIIVSVMVGIIVGSIAQAFPEGTIETGLLFSSWSIPNLILVAVFAQTIILLAAALSMPLLMRFGATKGARLVPVILVLALAAIIGFSGSSLEQADLFVSLGADELALYKMAAIAGAIVIAIYCVSAFVAARLYERREL